MCIRDRYPNVEQWRINLSFISLLALGSVGYFATEKFKKYLTLYYVIIYPFIAFLFIFFFISGGPVFFEFSYGIIDFAISIAGKTCPPVPPPLIIIFFFFIN